MDAYEAGAGLYFADPHLGRDATYRAGGSDAPLPIRVVLSQPDRQAEYGGSTVMVATTVIDVQVADVPAPTAGDTVTVDADTYVVQGAPRRDEARSVWHLDTRPQ